MAELTDAAGAGDGLECFLDLIGSGGCGITKYGEEQRGGKLVVGVEFARLAFA